VFEGMDAVVTLQDPARAELLGREVPAILRLLISVKPAFLLERRLELRDISKWIGKNGYRIKELQANHQLRLTIIGQNIGGWMSPKALPQDVTSENLCGLGQKLREQLLASKDLLDVQILQEQMASLQVVQNKIGDSTRQAIQVDDSNDARLVEVVVDTLAGGELLRRKLLPCTSSVTIRRQLQQAFAGKRAQLLFNERVLLDTDTFEQLVTQGQPLYIGVVFTNKTERQLRWEQLSEVKRRRKRLNSEYREVAKHNDSFRMDLVRDAMRRCL